MSYGEVTDKKDKNWNSIAIMEKTLEHKADALNIYNIHKNKKDI